MNSPKGGPQAEREFRPLSGTNILQTPHIYIIYYTVYTVRHGRFIGLNH